MLRLQTILKHIKTPMDIHKISELVGVKYATAKSYIKELHEQKLVYIVRYERTKAAFKAVYKLGNKNDAEKLERIPHWVYDMNRPKRPYKPRNKNYEQNTKPRRDVAASWF